MSTHINLIEPITDRECELLRAVGIHTTEQLLEQSATSSARMKLADLTHLSEETIKSWAHRADLMRVDGVGGVIADALCGVGVTTVPKLAYRSPESLHQHLQKIPNIQSVPSVAELETIITRAKALPKIIRH